MNWKSEMKQLAVIDVAFLSFFSFETEHFDNIVFENLHLAKWYTQEHTLLCLIPAFLIACTISVFVSQASVMNGAKANKVLAYSVASVSGTILAVCFCTALPPLFTGIYRMGAGLCTATVFLYFCPALILPNMLIIRSVLGTKKNIVFVNTGYRNGNHKRNAFWNIFRIIQILEVKNENSNS